MSSINEVEIQPQQKRKFTFKSMKVSKTVSGPHVVVESEARKKPSSHRQEESTILHDRTNLLCLTDIPHMAPGVNPIFVTTSKPTGSDRKETQSTLTDFLKIVTKSKPLPEDERKKEVACMPLTIPKSDSVEWPEAEDKKDGPLIHQGKRKGVGLVSYLQHIPSRVHVSHVDDAVSMEQTEDKKTQFLFVFLDLETTGLGVDSDITQIACICENQRFNRYILPKKRICRGSSRVTGIKVYKSKMYVNRKHVGTVSLAHGISDFISYLRRFQKPVVMVAHNGRAFDSKVLLNSLRIVKMEEAFAELVTGFLDTLPLFRALYPDLENHRQQFLAKTLLNEEYASHNAIEDVRMLKQLFHQAKLNHKPVLEPYISLVKDVQDVLGFQLCKKQKLSTFNVLVERNVISCTMAAKMAANGLTYDDLLLKYESDGANGLRTFLTESKGDGKPRVTKIQQILDDILKYFEEQRVELNGMKFFY